MPNSTSSPSRIVVGVDGSAPSLAALRWAGRLAGPLDAEIEVITTWMVPVGWVDAGWIDVSSPALEAERIQDAAIDQVFADKVPDGLIRRTPQAPAHQALIDASKSGEMIVLGNRGHGGFVGLLLGSVSTAVSAHAHCPVLVVH